MPVKNVNLLRWNNLSVFQVPNSVIADRLTLKPSSLKLLLVLYEKATRCSGLASFPIRQKELLALTGLSSPTLITAVKQLRERGWLPEPKPETDRERKKLGQYKVNGYALLHPRTGELLQKLRGSGLLGGNQGNGIPYFTVPSHVVTKFEKLWSLASLSGSAVAVYTCVLWRASFRKSSLFQVNRAELKTLSDLSASSTFNSALDDLELLGLARFEGSRELTVTVCDPYTGQMVQPRPDPTMNPANYRDKDGERFDINSPIAALNERLRPEEVEGWVRGHFSDVRLRGNEINGRELFVSCPYHKETDPSCAINPDKRCFHCHGCKEGGYVTNLMLKVNPLGHAAELAQMLGADYKAPTAILSADKADKIYEYQDENRFPVKRKLRFGDGPDKDFAWERFDGGEWKSRLKKYTRKHLLYNLPAVLYFKTKIVCITEGEKDADTVNALRLTDSSGEQVVATTSGASGSWADVLASDLVGKQVIIMPDTNDDGAKYRVAIEQSLLKRGVAYRVVSFEKFGVNDVSDFLRTHPADELVGLINRAGDGQLWVTGMVVEPEPAKIEI